MCKRPSSEKGCSLYKVLIYAMMDLSLGQLAINGKRLLLHMPMNMHCSVLCAHAPEIGQVGQAPCAHFRIVHRRHDGEPGAWWRHPGCPARPCAPLQRQVCMLLMGFQRVMCTELARIALLLFGIGLLSCAVVLTNSVRITLA